MSDLAADNDRFERNQRIRKHAASPITKPKKKIEDKKDGSGSGRAPTQPSHGSVVSEGAVGGSGGSGAGASLRAWNIDLWRCQHLRTTRYTKLFSTPCGNGFVKIVSDPRMVPQVYELENEAKIYSHLLNNGAGTGEAVPYFFGLSSHYRVPVLCLGLEGPSFEEIGLDSLSSSLKWSAIDSLLFVGRAGVLHGDLALRNIVQSKNDPTRAKIIDFGRACVTEDKSLL